MAAASQEDIFPFISSISYPNNKSKHLVRMTRQIVDEHGGKVPETVRSLESLAGVGHKTAQVVAGVAFGVPTLAVDTHVYRVAHRIGLVKNAPTPFAVGGQLKRLLPEDEWGEMHHLLILHGRYSCTARSPGCEDCPIATWCEYNSRRRKLPPKITGLNLQSGRYYCATRKHYFDSGDRVTDRAGVEQLSCPRCGSMNVFDAKTGLTTKTVRDFRV